MGTYVAAGIALIGGLTIGAITRWPSKRPSEDVDEPNLVTAKITISLIPDRVEEPSVMAFLDIEVQPDAPRL
ncbi:MAG TPA: hypothetical protein VGH27_06520 [Streptosporangiaceae bacterium]|jgi:hypothetical protein